MSATLTLTTDEQQEPIVLEPSCLLAFIDETGDEAYSDPKHPVFGLAGCLISVADYQAVIGAPWQDMKARLFNGAPSLHAADLVQPTPEQIEAIVSFFSDPRIHRFAAVATAATDNPDGIHPYQMVAVTMICRIEKLLATRCFSRLVLMVESSERTADLAKKYLGWYQRVLIREGQQQQELPINHFLLPKQLNTPGLEVADFVANVAGRHARQSAGGDIKFGKDFQAFFHAVPKGSVEFLRVTGARTNEEPGSR